jgi:hypothetical protein
VPVFSTTAKLFGGYALDRATFREFQADDRWLVYAAGWVDPKDGNIATVSLVYEKDDQTVISLGSVTQTGSGRVKKNMGPFDVFATPTVPLDESIPIIRLQAIKNAGVDGELDGWNLWVRHLPFIG